MKILFADKFPENFLTLLREQGHDCDYQPDLTADRLAEHITGVEVLVVRSTRVDSGVLGLAEQLFLVIRAGAGTNTIEKDFAASKGIAVSNVPGKNSIAVAELVMGLLLSIDRSIPDNVVQLREKQWNKKLFSKADGLAGKTLGIIGLGAIGQEVAKRAKAFEMQLLGYDIFYQQAKIDAISY